MMKCTAVDCLLSFRFGDFSPTLNSNHFLFSGLLSLRQSFWSWLSGHCDSQWQWNFFLLMSHPHLSLPTLGLLSHLHQLHLHPPATPQQHGDPSVWFLLVLGSPGLSALLLQPPCLITSSWDSTHLPTQSEAVRLMRKAWGVMRRLHGMFWISWGVCSKHF